ncbi:MAG: hypothetical protein WAM14_20290 [Candidatus Nitrosopolaris sp.]
MHKIVKDLGMEEQEIINVLELANNNQLEQQITNFFCKNSK